jgi:glycosyltransferase involved in cell wall biosynthesis
MTHKFCIVIPSYQSVGTLPDAVNSALAQEHDSFHVVVSDNNSTDGSAEYLKTISGDGITVVVHPNNVSKTENWNRAFRIAPPSEYLVMLHSDDWLYSTALKDLDILINKFPGASLYCGNHVRLALDGAITRKRIWPFAFKANSIRFQRLQILANCVSVVGTTFRQNAFWDVGGFDAKFDYAQDVALFDKLSIKGDVVYGPIRLGAYRDTPVRPSIASKWAKEQCEWASEAVTSMPIFLRPFALNLHASFQLQKVRAESPSESVKFKEYLSLRGIQPFPSELVAKLLRVFCANAYKSVLSIRTKIVGG